MVLTISPVPIRERFGYDAKGNVTSKNSQVLAFDVANRLTQVTGLQNYRYDGLGRRVQTTDADGKTTFWQYSQAGQVVYASEARLSRNTNYIYLGNTQIAQRHMAWGSGAVSVEYQHTDALGSPVAETNSTGAVVARTTYAPFGEALDQAVDGPGYTGHVMDEATGLTYMQQRYYDSITGRFLSVDPVATHENGDNFNRYAYAANSPYKFTDPDGREIGVAFAAINRDTTPLVMTAKGSPGEVGAVFASAIPIGRAARFVISVVKALASTSPKADGGSTSQGPLKNLSGDIEAAANAARSNPYPRRVTGHANQRLQTRDQAVTPQAMETAAVSGRRSLDPATGKTTHDLPASQSPSGRGVTVVTNPRGDVVTVIDKGTKFNPKPKP
jgi:RHS repeat-associated protein